MSVNDSLHHLHHKSQYQLLLVHDVVNYVTQNKLTQQHVYDYEWQRLHTISHSSSERMILPDAKGLFDYMLNRFAAIVDQLTVFPDNMKKNMNRTYGLIFSQRVMLKLIEKELSREEAYDLVQPKTKRAWDEGLHFRDLLEDDSRITTHLDKEALDDAFDPNYHIRNVDTIFHRVGLE